jgi:uncharacterized protein YpuA (DUF1002 family)
MCTAAIGMIMNVAGIFTSMQAAKAGAKAQAQSYEHQAKMQEQNAKLAQQQAQDASNRGFEATQDLRRKAGAFASTQKSLLAGQGTDTDSGDASKVLQDTAQNMELDAATLRYNAQLEKYGLLAQGQDYMAQADLSRTSADNARIAGKYEAMTTLLTGASTMASKYTKNKPATENSNKYVLKYNG